ncbi:hypothetical protein CB0940_06353 [Cercospora beticola]|uniref:F-box domain-containing protein n=1 Tax=Cercospora beticola TaxID=122368 RepID=A0A2G5I0U9_CERBT|nr:hypothetical protein CB0940_06353 [Cercospora beticola]PIA98153.1 hypothetical protein CB0940_06353 [Cercospora beticola]WPA98979.1 hypothetical protein RHO25_003592 [Cercospora beticola]CAK1360281.1 unnamed protein product [Cercospora beticola]
MSDEPDITTAPTTATSQEYTGEQECFRLFDLPPELVLRVLEFAVVISTKAKPLLIDSYWGFSWTPCLSAEQPAITRSCRLLREEGLKLFYTRNIFLGASSDEGASTFWRWAKCLGQQNLQRIDRLYVEWVGGSGEEFCQYQGGKLLDLEEGEMTARELFEEVVYLDSRNYNFKGPKPCFLQPDHGKIVLDVAWDHPRYRISFKDQDNDGSQLLVGGLDLITDHDIFRDGDAGDFWTAEERDRTHIES